MVKHSFVQASWDVWGRLMVGSVGLILAGGALALLYGVSQQLTAIFEGVLRLV